MPAKVLGVQQGCARIELPRDVTERASLKEGEELQLFSPGGAVFLLAREAARRGVFVGNLNVLSVGEVFGFVSSGIRTGLLVVQTRKARRTVAFKEGQISYATSTDPTERLGPILWRTGIITREQLEDAEPRVKPGLKLGTVLVESGALTPARLYRGMQLQVREIVLDIFTLSDGDFAFMEGEVVESQVKLPDRTRDLVLAGVKRAEQLELLRNTFDREARVERAALIDVEKLSAEQTALLELVDGARDLGAVVDACRLGEYHCLSAIASLAKGGQLRVGSDKLPKKLLEPRRDREPSVGRASPLQIYEQAIKHIAGVFNASGNKAGRLNTFFAHLPEDLADVFEGVVLTSSGGLDVESVLANAQRKEKGAIARALALDALDNFVAFALFDSRNILPERDAEALARDVRALLRGKPGLEK